MFRSSSSKGWFIQSNSIDQTLYFYIIGKLVGSLRKITDIAPPTPKILIVNNYLSLSQVHHYYLFVFLYFYICIKLHPKVWIPVINKVNNKYQRYTRYLTPIFPWSDDINVPFTFLRIKITHRWYFCYSTYATF